MAKKKFNDTLYRLRIFLWFLLTEPVRQLKEVFKAIFKVLDAFNKTITWAYIAIIGLIGSLFLGNRWVAAVLLGFFLFIVLFWEWERGFFIYRYRQVTKKKIERKAKKMESMQDSLYDDDDYDENDDDFRYSNKEEYVNDIKGMDKEISEEYKNGRRDNNNN